MSKVLRVCRLAKYCVLVVHVAGCAAFCILGSCLRLCTSCGHFEAVDDQVVLAGATTCSSGGGHWAGPHAHLGGILLCWQGRLSSRVTRRNLIWCWQCFRNLLRGGGAVQQCPVEGGQWGILGGRQHFDGSQTGQDYSVIVLENFFYISRKVDLKLSDSRNIWMM